MPKKVGGARWSGKKTRLGSDSEDEEAEPPHQQQQCEEVSAAAPPAGQVITKSGIVIIMPGPREQQQQQQKTGDRPLSTTKTKTKKRKGNEQLEANAVQQVAAVEQKLNTKQQKQRQQQEVVKSSRVKQKHQQQSSPHCHGDQGQLQFVNEAQQAIKQAAADPAAGICSKKGVKWAKLAAKILEGAPRKRMKVRKLHAKIVAAAGYDVEAPGVDTEQLFQHMLRKLKRAEGLAVCEKYVGLSAAP
jgi:hypothetical protein